MYCNGQRACIRVHVCVCVCVYACMLLTAADGERRHEATKQISAEGLHVQVLALGNFLRHSSAISPRNKPALRSIYPVTVHIHEFVLLEKIKSNFVLS